MGSQIRDYLFDRRKPPIRIGGPPHARSPNSNLFPAYYQGPDSHRLRSRYERPVIVDLFADWPPPQPPPKPWFPSLHQPGTERRKIPRNIVSDAILPDGSRCPLNKHTKVRFDPIWVSLESDPVRFSVPLENPPYSARPGSPHPFQLPHGRGRLPIEEDGPDAHVPKPAVFDPSLTRDAEYRSRFGDTVKTWELVGYDETLPTEPAFRYNPARTRCPRNQFRLREEMEPLCYKNKTSFADLPDGFEPKMGFSFLPLRLEKPVDPDARGIKRKARDHRLPHTKKNMANCNGHHNPAKFDGLSRKKLRILEELRGSKIPALFKTPLEPGQVEEFDLLVSFVNRMSMSDRGSDSGSTQLKKCHAMPGAFPNSHDTESGASDDGNAADDEADSDSNDANHGHDFDGSEAADEQYPGAPDHIKISQPRFYAEANPRRDARARRTARNMPNEGKESRESEVDSSSNCTGAPGKSRRRRRRGLTLVIPPASHRRILVPRARYRYVKPRGPTPTVTSVDTFNLLTDSTPPPPRTRYQRICHARRVRALDSGVVVRYRSTLVHIDDALQIQDEKWEREEAERLHYIKQAGGQVGPGYHPQMQDEDAGAVQQEEEEEEEDGGMDGYDSADKMDLD